MTKSLNTIPEILAAQDGAANAIGAPGRGSISYGALADQAMRIGAALNAGGIGRGDRVAIVLPNGPEMAAAFLCVAGSASAAPLNPAYTRDEFAFYLGDLHARAVIVEEGSASPALKAAADLGVPVLRVGWDGAEPAGTFRFTAFGLEGRAGRPGPAQPQDEALVLHTSGTTSRPKVVPLTNANLAASARHIGETLKLSGEDAGLNIMPLFHIHGLVASLLSSMAAGAHVVCTPGFDALRFFRWFEEARPTWVTAVPTMHQAILARARRNQAALEASRLRFLRSSSSSLPPPVMREMEEVFGCPVIEAYGMTEAAHQMASSPLPPLPRKPGTVGIAAGPEIALMDETGALKGRGGSGEIVIRGPNVFAGYENNPEANRTAFANGWFRTGDLGVMDADGYLTISGRLKEIINRGGEKIAPREVDDVLQDHPAIAQVVTFAVPHDKLGEDVAAVVVFRDGESAEASELRAFAAERLAAFKVPSRIIVRDEIPKGATGKLQRIGLAEKLGLTG
ncbi:MAG: acyl--CoA ligase [Paracoccaceae bacterium]